MFQYKLKDQETIDKLLRVTPEEKEKIRKLKSGTDEQLKQILEHLKDWWKKQPHLPPCPDDETIERLIMYNKFSIEKCKRKLEHFFSIPHIFPEFFSDRSPFNQNIKAAFQAVENIPLPKLAPDGGRVTVTRPLASKYDIDTVAANKRTFMLMDFRVCADFCATDHLIADMKYETLKGALRANPIAAKKYITSIEKGYSDSLASIHVLNMPSFAVNTFQMFKGLIKEKIANRIIIHENESDLLNYFPKEILPKDYGGEEKGIAELNEEWLKLFQSNSEFFENMELRKSKEELRIGEPYHNELLGLEGSFRQLTVD